jgi:hypothetical protein
MIALPHIGAILLALWVSVAADSNAVVRVTGTALVPEEVAREAIGSGPSADDKLEDWGEKACRRIVDAYRKRGYGYARAWFSANAQPGVFWFYVDEGRMRVVFIGIGSVGAFFYRLGLNLPGDVFQDQAVARALDELKTRYSLLNVYYRVREIDGEEESPFLTAFGRTEMLFASPRLLQVYIIRRETYGYALDLSVSAAWGITPAVSYSERQAFLVDDRLYGRVEFAFPFRQYLFEESPAFRWIHGGGKGSYRFPRFPSLPLAPRLDGSLFLSRFQRIDLNLDRYYVARGTFVPSLVMVLPMSEISLGLGLDLARVFLLRPEPGTPPPVDFPGQRTSVRPLVRATATVDFGSALYRRDQRTFVSLVADVGAQNFRHLNSGITLYGQYFQVLGRHRLIGRGRAVGLAGAVPFWDEVELAGEYQHVFFDNLYWVRQALQIELGYRINIWRHWFQVGALHDLSLFRDRTRPGSPWAAANAIGPSLEFLLFDLYALNLQEAIGFAPGHFRQTFSLSLRTIF